MDARLLMYAAGLELGGSIAREQANGGRPSYIALKRLGSVVTAHFVIVTGLLHESLLPCMSGDVVHSKANRSSCTSRA